MLPSSFDLTWDSNTTLTMTRPDVRRRESVMKASSRDLHLGFTRRALDLPSMDRTGRASWPPSRWGARASRRNMRILVVEDDAKVGGFLEQGLREEEFEVWRAYDGEEAISMALNQHYNLILLDYMLPKRTGPQVVKALRDQGRLTPILMLTAREGPEDIQLCLASGANAYLTKPFRFADLLDQIQRLAGARREG